MAAAEGSPERSSALAPLRSGDFRLLVLSTTSFYAARGMEGVVQGWLVLEITGSPFWVGLLGALRYVGWVLSPLSGAVSDRLRRPQILLAAQSVNVLAAIVLLGVIVADRIEVWHVLLAALLASITFALDFPSRSALVRDLVAERELLGALGVSRGALNGALVLGSLLGGSLLLVVGYSGSYELIAGLYVAGLVALLPLGRLTTMSANKASTVWRDLGDGLRYCLGEPRIRAILALAFFINLLLYPVPFGLMPVVARDLLGVGAGGLGGLAAAYGSGAVVGSLAVFALGRWRRRGLLLPSGFVLPAVLAVAFILTPWVPLAFFLWLLVGMTQEVALITSQAVLLEVPAGEMRGKVMGVRGVAIVALPVGSLVGGALSDRIGVQETILLFLVAYVVLAVAVLLAAPLLRQWR